MKESIDDLLALIPDEWDFWIGSDWNSEGKVTFYARLQMRCLGEYLHYGHHVNEINCEGSTLREALSAAVSQMQESIIKLTLPED